MSYDLMFQKANNLYMNGSLDEAEQLYRHILEAVPENPDVLNMMGLTAQAKNMHQQAVSYFSQALKFAPRHLPLYFNLAVSYQNLEKYVQALDAYKKALELNPNIKEIYNNAGAVYEKLNNPQQAGIFYQNAINLDENYIDALVNLALLNKDFAQLEKLNQKYYPSTLILYTLAKHNFEQQNYVKSLQLLEEINLSERNLFEIQHLKSEIYLALKKYDEAKQTLNITLELNPKHVKSLIMLADLEESEALYLKALDLEPDNLDAHAHYAGLLHKQGRLVESLEEYRKAIIINPDLPELSNNLALILKDLEEYEQALDLLMNAFVKDKTQKDFWINISETLVLLYKKEPDKALKIAQRWKETAPDNIFAQHILASFKGNSENTNQKYAKELFDTFASTYDATMQKIKYAILDKIEQIGISLKGNILDLGCGTGAVGLRFANNKTSFTGVDISQNMLNIAAQNNKYATLINADITTFAAQNKDVFDFIIATDVFEYVPDIENIIKHFDNTTFIFNIEKASPDVKEYTLSYNGRHQHNPKYVKEILLKCGYKDISEYNLDIRQEDSFPVEGVLFVAKKYFSHTKN